MTLLPGEGIAILSIFCLFGAAVAALALLGGGWSTVVALLGFCFYFTYRANKAAKSTGV